VPSFRNIEIQRIVYNRARKILFERQFRQPGHHIQPGQRFGCLAKFGQTPDGFLNKTGEDFQFEGQNLPGGFGYLALQFAKFDRRKAHRAGERLAVDKQFLVCQKLIGLRWRNFDVIADNLIVTYLQGRNAAFLDVFLLQTGNMAAVVVP